MLMRASDETVRPISLQCYFIALFRLCASVHVMSRVTVTHLAIETETKLAEYKSSWLEARNGRRHAFSLTRVSKTPAKNEVSIDVSCLSAGIRGEVLMLKIGPIIIPAAQKATKQVRPQPKLAAQ